MTAFDELIEAAPLVVSDEWLLFDLRGERLLVRLLAATLEPEHNRTPMLQAFDEEYKQLSLPFLEHHCPTSADTISLVSKGALLTRSPCLITRLNWSTPIRTSTRGPPHSFIGCKASCGGG